MFKGFLTGFIIIVFIIAIILYVYGRKTISGMSTPKTDAYVENTTDTSPSPVKGWVEYIPPSKKFNAKFPSSPQNATDRSTDVRTKELKQYEMYISEVTARSL